MTDLHTTMVSLKWTGRDREDVKEIHRLRNDLAHFARMASTEARGLAA